VPGLLVYVDAARRFVAGERWTIRRGELLPREIPPDSTLYIATVRDGRARLIAYLEPMAAAGDELGDATACDLDLGPLLERLGCSGGVDGFPAWATGPRILDPSDGDLLRYRLGLPLDVIAPPPLPPPPPRPAAPAIPFPRDPAARELLAAVYEDLASDGSRMVLADRLLELGDPRGEMMALQLARARAGTPATAHERELIARHGRAWAQPLTRCLAAFGFRRGFLAMATVDDRAMMEPALYAHAAWATVEELETGNAALLLSPALRSLRRVAIPGELLEVLARQDRPLPIDTVVGRVFALDGAPGRFVQSGVAIPRGELPELLEGTALDRVRAMSLSIESASRADRAERFLQTASGRRLDHVELFSSDLPAADAERWRRVYERNRPLSLGLRGVVDGWIAAVVRQRRSIVLQLGDPVMSRLPDVWPIAPALASLGRGLRSLRIEHVGEARPGEDLQPVVRALQRIFPAVELRAVHRWRSP
jgi:uncharacterized protein (TIGR02996 family)